MKAQNEYRGRFPESYDTVTPPAKLVSQNFHLRIYHSMTHFCSVLFFFSREAGVEEILQRDMRAGMEAQKQQSEGEGIGRLRKPRHQTTTLRLDLVHVQVV